MAINLYDIVSDVHNEGYIDTTLADFLNEIEEGMGEKFVHCSQSSFDDESMEIIFIKSGGVEGKFKEIYERFHEPYILLSSGIHNSFAASLEILSFLRQKGKKAEILHGTPEQISGRIRNLKKIMDAKRRLGSARLGVVGAPSEWLIASSADYKRIKEILGVEIIDIGIKELMDEIDKGSYVKTPETDEILKKGFDRKSTLGCLKIYGELKALVERYNLQGVTVRCFDLIAPYSSTGCLAMSLLNDEGIIAGCEGDVPSLLSMLILNYLTGESAFMANPSSVDVENNTAVLAHCTIPLHMASSYTLDTHFESGLGVGIKGVIQTGPGTIFKVSPNLDRMFVSGIDIMENLDHKDLCRTQIRIKLRESVRYFLENPIGNHHIVCRNDYSSLIKEFFKNI